MKPTYRTLFLLVLSLVFALTAVGQTYRGAVRGTIYDPNGAAMPGATVTITNTTTGEARTATTGEQGEYAITALS